MVKLIKKILLEFSNGLIDEKKVITIGEQDYDAKRRQIVYMSSVRGTRYGKKSQIKVSEFEELKRSAVSMKILKTY